MPANVAFEGDGGGWEVGEIHLQMWYVLSERWDKKQCFATSKKEMSCHVGIATAKKLSISFVFSQAVLLIFQRDPPADLVR